MQDLVSQAEDLAGIEIDRTTSIVVVSSIIFLTAAVVHIFLHWVVLQTFEKRTIASSRLWLQVIIQNRPPHRLVFILQGIIVNVQAIFWLQKSIEAAGILTTCVQLRIMMYALLPVFSLLDVILNLARESSAASQPPPKGTFQGAKLTGAILVGILMIPLLIDQSSAILINDFSVMAAVLMLVSRDLILGPATGTQFSANDMLKSGDWLEVPKYGADGVVVDIGLATVKVRSQGSTVTTIPTWSLVSDSFRNWSGMSASGGRRIKRGISIDVISIRFLDEDEMQRLSKAHLLRPYSTSRHQGINEWNRQQSSTESILNLRRMTNTETLRVYLNKYLRNHSWVRKDITLMVHQSAPGDNGLSPEIYTFTNTMVWLEYESIQADIFDHVFATIEEFSL